MCIKVTIVSKEFVTLLVVMGFLTSVYLHVLLKVTRILEGLSTLVTREIMNQYMGLQLPRCLQGFRA